MIGISKIIEFVKIKYAYFQNPKSGLSYIRQPDLSFKKFSGHTRLTATGRSNRRGVWMLTIGEHLGKIFLYLPQCLESGRGRCIFIFPWDWGSAELENHNNLGRSCGLIQESSFRENIFYPKYLIWLCEQSKSYHISSCVVRITVNKSNSSFWKWHSWLSFVIWACLSYQPSTSEVMWNCSIFSNITWYWLILANFLCLLFNINHE